MDTTKFRRWQEQRKINLHNERMKLARERLGTHIICPYCYERKCKCE